MTGWCRRRGCPTLGCLFLVEFCGLTASGMTGDEIDLLYRCPRHIRLHVDPVIQAAWEVRGVGVAWDVGWGCGNLGHRGHLNGIGSCWNCGGVLNDRRCAFVFSLALRKGFDHRSPFAHSCRGLKPLLRQRVGPTPVSSVAGVAAVFCVRSKQTLVVVFLDLASNAVYIAHVGQNSG